MHLARITGMGMARVLDNGARMIRLALLALVLVGCNERGRGGMFPDGGGSGTGDPCGGFTGELCASNEFCDFASDTCGVSDEQGRCRARPTSCDDRLAPVCGCDGVTHSNECSANAAGVDVSASGSCPVPAGQFACGSRTCETETEYCQHSVSDIGGVPDSFACRPLPSSCGSGSSASCDCLAEEPCSSVCDGTPSDGLRLTCFGG
jgi:hypothetical protein